jgi:curved DNA-binding protein CbpA
MSSEKSRQHHDGSSGRAFTVDQKAAVVRVRKCSPTAFYDILGLESTKTSASESDIKKAYRKLSLLTHPDKNGYDGADEAFKMVARAFAVLSDADKKAKFDRFGGDPDSRFQGASASSASPFSGGGATRRQAGGGMFDDEISPEDLFRQFFGGGGGMGMGGGGFGGGPFGMLCLHSSFSPRLSQLIKPKQAAVSSTALVSSSTWAAAPVSACTNSAAAHRDDDPNKLLETPTHHPPPSCNHYNPCYLFSSSSSSLFSPASSPATAHPQAPLCVSTPYPHSPNNASPAVSASPTTSTPAKSRTSQRGNGKSWIRGQTRITTTNFRMSVRCNSKGDSKCINRRKASSLPIKSSCSRPEGWKCLRARG